MQRETKVNKKSEIPTREAIENRRNLECSRSIDTLWNFNLLNGDGPCRFVSPLTKWSQTHTLISARIQFCIEFNLINKKNRRPTHGSVLKVFTSTVRYFTPKHIITTYLVNRYNVVYNIFNEPKTPKRRREEKEKSTEMKYAILYERMVMNINWCRRLLCILHI